MAQRLVELCTLFVENTFGELAAQIFSVLASRGRSSIPTLIQLTRLHSDHIRAGLALLIQHHIVKYYDQDEDDSRAPAFYHADLNAAYNLVRAHKYINIVTEREGEAAGKLLANIFELGHASVGDLENEYDLTPASKRDSGIDTVEQHITEEGLVNGIAKDGKHKTTSDIYSIAEFHSTLRKLLDQGYLVKATERLYMPQADFDKEAEEVVIAENETFQKGKTTGKKQREQLDVHLNTLKRKWEDEDTYSKSRDVASKGVIQRSKKTSPSNKRVKVNGDIPNGVHGDSNDEYECSEEFVPKLPNDLFVRVNFTKCTLLLRNRRLQQMAHYHLGAVPAAVFGAFLRCLEKDGINGRVKAQPLYKKGSDGDVNEELPSVADAEVLEYLDKTIDLAEGVKIQASSTGKQPNGVSKRKVLSEDPDEAELGIKVEIDSDADDEEQHPVNGFRNLKERNKRLALVSMHLNILAEHNKHFVTRTAEKKKSYIDIAALTTRLVQDEVDTMIGNRYSNIETRIVRCLRERGKLEEKSVQAMCMMRLMPLRMHLTFLQFAGICEAQEIPKDASRQPNRSLFLWFFPEKRVVNQYLHRAYQGMSRTLQRLRIERDGKFRAVIEKAERVDVKGREQELLNLAEKNLLKEWRETEEKLLVQVDRLDDLVGVLRDFSGTDTSLTHN